MVAFCIGLNLLSQFLNQNCFFDNRAHWSNLHFFFFFIEIQIFSFNSCVLTQPWRRLSKLTVLKDSSIFISKTCLICVQCSNSSVFADNICKRTNLCDMITVILATVFHVWYFPRCSGNKTWQCLPRRLYGPAAHISHRFTMTSQVCSNIP